MNLSMPQKAIYNMAKVSGDAIAVNCSSLLISGSKTVAEIQKTVNMLFRTNDVLRLQITDHSGIPSQAVSDFYEQQFEVLSFSSKSQLDTYATTFCKEPLPLSGKLCDIKIVFLPEQYGLLVKLHHIVSDAWTFGLLFSQFIAFLQGKAVPEYTYTDYLETEKRYLESKRYVKDREFFLGNISACGEPVFLCQNDKVASPSMRKVLTLTPEETQEIFRFSKNNNCSVFSLFSLTLAVYISRLKMNTEKLFLGTTVLNRYSEKDLNTAGIFVNVVPMYFEIACDQSFSENLLHTEDSLLSVFRHQKYNYNSLLSDLYEQHKSQNKLFDVMVNYMNRTISHADQDVHSEWYHNGVQNESLQINIDDRDIDGYLKLHYDYQVDKFSEQDIDLLHQHLCNLLFDAIRHPEKKICELNMLCSAETQRLRSFNDTIVPYPKEQTIHGMFEAQAERVPDSIAVVACDRVLTCRQLNEQANRIAHSLIEMGAERGKIIAFRLSRTSRSIAAMMGILKTGAAYLPIDPYSPAARTDFMLSDSGAMYCITDETVGSLLLHENVRNPDIQVDSRDLCYCIYTSGSTGKPKGTLLAHKNVVNYISANDKNVCYGITGNLCRSTLSVASLAFDFSVSETLLPLANGMEILLADEEQSRQQSKLIELLRSHPADMLQTTPTKMRAFMADKSRLGYLKDFRVIILGGEALDSALAKELQQYTDASIYNLYGPTEAAVFVTYSHVSNGDDITIGRPIANTQIHIVDRYLKPVPVGVEGELCIGGANVGQGYLNAPELTAEKFVDNPFGEGKLYRTGDLARWREDGQILYCGRMDSQVKIRGLRIELGEIEDAISHVEGIEHCAVTVQTDSRGRQLICAFYTGNELPAQQIREAISLRLPHYMLPHIFTYLEHMPLTSSGKTDRKALPVIDPETVSTDTEYVAPVTRTEQLLIERAMEILGIGRISMLDNFFDLGGDSLKAIELTALLEQTGYTIPVKTFFACKDMRQLADALQEKTAEPVTATYGSCLPATAAQLRVYTSQLLKPDSAHYNIPYAFRVKELDTDRLEDAVNKLIARHECLRTRFENRDGQIFQVIEDTVRICPEELPAEDMSLFNAPFDLETAPLMKVGYRKNTIFIVTHHIITDGTSVAILFRELNELYMGRDLPPAVQYGTFAVTDSYTQENEDYWLNVFSGEIPVLNLKTDFERPAFQSFAGSQVYDLLDLQTHSKILNKCKALNVTPFVFYMACYNVLLSKYSGAEDMVVGTPISGRTGRFLDTVGMFVNTVPLRIKPEGSKTVLALLQELREHSLSAIEHQNYPLGTLLGKLNISITGRNPLWDVLFAYQAEQMTDITFGDAEAEVLPIPLAGVKCDLNFNIYPRKEDVVLLVEYSTDLFREETIREWIAAYRSILEQALDETILIRDIDAIPLQHKQLLHSFNDTSRQYTLAEQATLYSLFERTARNYRGKVCIKTADRQMTFEELLHASEQLDSKLRSLTGNTKSVIAVIAERSAEMYAAIYGIIRGGNAYLPIDPAYPHERIAYILESSGAAAVTAQGAFAHLAGNVPCVDMTAFLQGCGFNTDEVPSCAATPEDTAYVIYTSGSTGRPKGAKISHASAVNRILWMQETYPLTSEDVILQKTPYTFDVSVWEIFWWGLCGGTLAASSPGEHFLPAQILAETYRGGVTHLHFVPSVFELFLNYLETHREELFKFRSVRYVFLSGEALGASLVQRFYKLYPGRAVTLHNLYGPTECAVDVTYYACSPSDVDPVPIGRPIANTQIHIVDRYLKPVPIGVEGELCIAGANVGQGYLNAPELTEEKFVDNPFGEGKLYRTGDLARWREDGQILYCGRMDSQVKFNGQRIETAEIESVMSRVSGIDATAVIVKKANGKQLLVAFFTGEKDRDSVLRKICSEKLPRYMVPSVFVHLDRLPMNRNGKLDRNALEQMDLPFVNTEQELPQTDDERFICQVFQRILGEDTIGRNSNFFEQGGTSLSMISLLSEPGFEALTVADLIRNPTPAALAQIRNTRSISTLAYLEPLHISGTTKRSLILLPFAGGGAEAYSQLATSLRQLDDSISLYFIRYLASLDECKAAAREIAAVCAGTEVLLYSHCVGSALALQILQVLEEEGVPVSHYFAGASIPPRKPAKRNIWNLVPDWLLGAVLQKAGAKLGGLPDNIRSGIFQDFRKHTSFANNCFSALTRKTQVPVSIIISKQDLFTGNYRHAVPLWEKYANKIHRVFFMETASHYFQRDHSERLAEILLSVLKDSNSI